MEAPAKNEPVQYTLAHSATYNQVVCVKSGDTIVVVGVRLSETPVTPP